MNYNILDGGTGRIDPICHVIESEKPDVVLLCDATDHKQVMTIARKLQMEVFPAQSPRTPHGAVALLSKWEIADAVNAAAIDVSHQQAAMMARVRQQGSEVIIWGVHLAAGKGMSFKSQPFDEINAIVRRSAGRPDDATILLGNLNSAGAGEPRVPADDELNAQTANAAPLASARPATDEADAFLRANGWIDTQSAESGVVAPTPNYPTYGPTSRPDRIFVKNTPRLHISGYHIVQSPLAKFASDHYPIVADITF